VKVTSTATRALPARRNARFVLPVALTSSFALPAAPTACCPPTTPLPPRTRVPWPRQIDSQRCGALARVPDQPAKAKGVGRLPRRTGRSRFGGRLRRIDARVHGRDHDAGRSDGLDPEHDVACGRYDVCVEFPVGEALRAEEQLADAGVLFVNSITTNSLGNHPVIWFVEDVEVGSWTFRMDAPPLPAPAPASSEARMSQLLTKVGSTASNARSRRAGSRSSPRRSG
jgi:hypothetical protein